MLYSDFKTLKFIHVNLPLKAFLIISVFLVFHAIAQGQIENATLNQASSEISVKQLDSIWTETNTGDSLNLLLSNRDIRFYRWDNKIEKNFFFYRDINDSTWYGRKIVYQYAANVLTTSITYSSFPNNIANWVPISKQERLTDSTGLSSRTYYEWDGITQKWMFDDKRETIRNHLKQITRINNFRWENDVWEIYETYDYTYYNDSLLANCIYLQWNTDNEAWQPISKTEYIYENQSNTLTQTNEYIWDWGWAITAKTDYLKDANNRDTAIINYEFYGLNNWLPIYKERLGYDSFGYQSFYEQAVYSDTSGWRTTQRNQTVNAPNGRILDHIYYYLNYQYDSLMKSRRYEFAYNTTYDKMLEQKTLFWDTANATWKPDYKYNYSYDADGDNTLSKSYIWNDTISQWDLNVKTTYFYGNEIDLEEYVLTGPYVYPNAASEHIRFMLPEKSESLLKLRLYDLKGREVLSQKIKPTEMVQLRAIPNGLYVYKIMGGSRNYAGKLLIRH